MLLANANYKYVFPSLAQNRTLYGLCSIDTANQPADLLTKRQPTPRFMKLKTMIGVT